MKKILLMLICLVTLCSCGKGGDSFFDSIIGIFDKECEVTFKTNDDSLDKVATVERGSTVERPENPFTKEETFIGWYTEDGYLFDFDTEIKKDLTLEARYQETDLSTEEVEYVLGASVIVKGTYYNKFLWIKTSGETQTGSGVIYYEDDTHYYVLTNNHVIVDIDERDVAEYNVYDCFGNEYEAEIYASSANYDLAIVRFEKGRELEVIERNSSDPLAKNDVIAIGQPNGNINSISYGEVHQYSYVNLSDADTKESNITFPVIVHTALIDNGSSGGPLLNSELKLIGINYAGGISKDGSVVVGYAVPIQKVEEFINYYKA